MLGTVRAQLNERRKQRQNLSAFASLIATPGNLVTGVALPANGKLVAACAAALADIGPLVSVNGTRTIFGSAGAAGNTNSLGYYERDVTLTKAPGAAGVVTLYVQDSLGNLHKIAEG